MNKTTIVLIALIVLLITNMISYQLMRHDKRSAQRGGRRVPESKLFLATTCFGGLGGVLGMQLLRHKTKHWHFKLFFPLMLALQVVLLGVGVYLLFR